MGQFGSLPGKTDRPARWIRTVGETNHGVRVSSREAEQRTGAASLARSISWVGVCKARPTRQRKLPLLPDRDYVLVGGISPRHRATRMRCPGPRRRVAPYTAVFLGSYRPEELGALNRQAPEWLAVARSHR